jgi:hypothetical protein
VVIPVILGVKAEGNSAVQYRLKYLELTLHSLAPFYKYIAVFVSRAEDAADLRNMMTTLPIWYIFISLRFVLSMA